MTRFRVAIIGAGILGCSIAYFLSSSMRQGRIILIEQEARPAQHASSRNTGKVHAPFLYDPKKKRLFARAAYLGFEMWRKYASEKGLPFKQDGVLEVATDQRSEERLHRYLEWGKANGLQSQELTLLDRPEVNKLEPNVVCEAALLCTRDASVDYGAFTGSLASDCQHFGITMLLQRKVLTIHQDKSLLNLTLNSGETLQAEFIINTAGGNSLNIAQQTGLARNLAALYFRGEYWRAPVDYRNLTKNSIYSVPRHPEYPFLDPHWIIRSNGQVDIGPNAVPVSSSNAYDWNTTIKNLPSFLYNLISKGALRIFADPEFLSLASAEWRSSLSKDAMIQRVREFLPRVNSRGFTQRGFAGIRTVMVDQHGKFMDDALIFQTPNSIHILNYNSPGASGALPMGALIANQVLEKGDLQMGGIKRGLWDAASISESMHAHAGEPQLM